MQKKESMGLSVCMALGIMSIQDTSKTTAGYVKAGLRLYSLTLVSTKAKYSCI